MHGTGGTDIIAAELACSPCELGTAPESEKSLEGRLEVVPPPHREVIALARDRHEIKVKLPGETLETEARVRLVVEHARRNLCLAAGNGHH